MPYALTLEFKDVDESQCWAVNDKLGIERDGSGDWPEGLLVHTAGPTPDGWVVSEVWSSRAAHEGWMAGRLGTALAAVGVPAPVQVIDTDTVSYQQLG